MDALALLDDLAAELPELRRRRMMGRPTLHHGSRMLACLDEGVLGIRLMAGTDAFERAMALPGAGPFSPAGRTFSDWVAVPPEQHEQWSPLLRAAMAAG